MFVMSPVAEMSQSLELTATVAELLPSVVMPVLESVVNAPVETLDAPIVVPLMLPPVIVAPELASVFAVVDPVKSTAPVCEKVANVEPAFCIVRSLLFLRSKTRPPVCPSALSTVTFETPEPKLL